MTNDYAFDAVKCRLRRDDDDDGEGKVRGRCRWKTPVGDFDTNF